MSNPNPTLQTPISAPRKRNLVTAYLARVGAGSLMLSIAIHGGLVALAVLIVTVTTKEPAVDFLPGNPSKGAQAVDHEITQKSQEKKRNTLNRATPMHRIAVFKGDVNIPDVKMDDLPVSGMANPLAGLFGIGAIRNVRDGVSVSDNIGLGTKEGIMPLPKLIQGRCSKDQRLQKLKEAGVGPETERAVFTALEYFKATQNKDGSWGSSSKCAMTGLALLCYLGHCETPDSAYYGETVMKGIMFLMEAQNKNSKGLFSEATTGNAPVYEHGIGTYAMGEMYALARLGGKSLPGMREAFEKGVKVIIDNQQKGGSWVYDVGSGGYSASREDLSVTGWQYQALKAAKLSGLTIEGLHPAIEKTVKYLETKQTKEGGLGGSNRETAYNQWHLTGVGVLGLQTLAQGKTAQIKKGIKFASELHQKEPPAWKTAELYDWYYYAQIYFQNGGASQKYWNETALPEVLKNQAKDGSWSKPPNDRHSTDKVMSTALCTLMLEVYYRYLRVGDREQNSIFSR